MEENFRRRSHVPAFGSWDCNEDGLPFTQCFESARQPGFFPVYTHSQDRDLYVTGDIYENDVVTPAMIVVPRPRARASYQQQGKKAKKEASWVACDVVKVLPPSPVPLSPAPPQLRKAPKAVDEDLYKISPELMYAKPKRKRIGNFFSSCLLPTCVS